ncbi:uncharacterized protein LOC144711720 isoform X2 [Wolffia australiana]
MKAETRLDAAVFLLTPTRTRCELVIRANGAAEKIASGLLNPFLAHLKTAREQMAKGGYSITLEPHPDDDAPWFTKATLERFVRFVSTPEVLERVDTIESEILQFDEAIRIQSHENFCLNTVEEEHSGFGDHAAGSRKSLCSDAASAIVLYQPGLLPEPGGCKARHEDSKEHFLRVLESRKMVLQNEQGMAFARAAAAGFHAGNMADLISFADCFGAKRMLKACLRFEELWRSKDETTRHVDVDVNIHPPDAMSMKSELPSCMSSIDVHLSPDTAKRRDFTEQWATSHPNLTAGDNHENSPEGRSRNPGWNSQVPLYAHPYYVLPHCPVHPSSNAAPFPFQPYGVPCYQNHFSYGPNFPPTQSDQGFKVDRRRDLGEGQRHGSFDLGGEQTTACAQSREVEGCRKTSENQGPCRRSSFSEFQREDPVPEERTPISKKPEQETELDPGNWHLPPSLLPRIGGEFSGEDPVLVRDRGRAFFPEEITTFDGIKKQQPSHDQDDASLMMMMNAARGTEGESDGLDPSREFSKILMRSFANRCNVLEEKSAELVKEGTEKEAEEKENKKKMKTAGSLLRKKSSPVKLSPSAEAQARANKLRAFKADLQRAKKEKEEEEQKRLEALKKQRQQRIATKSSSAARSPVTPDQKKPSSFTWSRAAASGSTRSRPTASIKSKLGGSSSSLGTPPGRAEALKRTAAPGGARSTQRTSLPEAARRKEEAGGAASLTKRASQALRRLTEARSGGGSQTQRSSAPPERGGSGGLAASPAARSASRPKKTASPAAAADRRRRPWGAPGAEKKPAPSQAGSRFSRILGAKTKTLTQEKARNEEKALAEMGNRFPQAEAAPPPLTDDCQPSSAAIVAVEEERKIGAPAKEPLAKSVRFSLADQQQRQRGHHRRAASLGETSAVQNPTPGEARRLPVAATGGHKDVVRGSRETLKGLRNLFKLGKKTAGDSSLHPTSPQEPNAFRRFSILSSFRSKKSSAA